MTTPTTRLHITPLTPELLGIILGHSSNRTSRNTSYHEIQTFPEKNFGYVDLPTMEAEKLKKKLNGSILKGNKIKIEDAKPQKRKIHELDSSAAAGDSLQKPNTTKGGKQSKTMRDVLPGHELSPDRKVKRGWTEPKKTQADKKTSDKTERQKSKYTDKEELLFRTNVPLNKAVLASDSKKKGKKSRSRQIVHEFAKSAAQPSFLKQSGRGAHPTMEYIDGQGWVDAAGNVVEVEPSTLADRRKATKQATQLRSSPIETTKQSPSPESGVKSTRIERQDPECEPAKQAVSKSSESEDAETPTSSSAPPTPPTAEDPVQEETNQAKVHPLEALFKKPQKPASSQDVAKPSLELATSNFSFFDADAGDDTEEDLSVPGTPYSSQDARARGLRSAAPTPDTAHPSRFNSYGSTGLPGDEEDYSDDEEYQQPASSTQDNLLSQPSAGRDQQSDFEKVFWEKRGENNRAWKARRRTVLKEKRQRENRARRLRNW